MRSRRRRRSFGPAHTRSSAGQPEHLNSLGVGTNSPASIGAIAADSSASSAGSSSRSNVVATTASGALEEVVDDLDLVGAGAEARERVDEPLQPVVGLDDLLGRALGERVRLVVERRARAAPSRHSTSSRPCSSTPSCSNANGRSGSHPGSVAMRARELRLAVRVDERRDPRELLVGHRRVPAAHELDVGRRGRSQVDELEQAVHRVADLGRLQAASPPGTSRAPRAGRRRARRSSGRSSARTARAPSTRGAAPGAAAAAAAARSSGRR